MTTNYHLTAPGDVFTSDEANLLMRQSIIGCTSDDTPSDFSEGMAVWLTDRHQLLVWTAAGWWPAWNQPWGVLDHVTATVVQGPVSTAVDVSGWSVTAEVPANRLIRVALRFCITTDAGSSPRFVIQRDGSSIHGNGWARNDTPNDIYTGTDWAFDSPAAGTHTYQVNAEDQGSGTSFVLSNDVTPMYLTLEDCGPTAAPA